MTTASGTLADALPQPVVGEQALQDLTASMARYAGRPIRDCATRARQRRARTRVAVAGLLVALTGCSSDSAGRVDDRAQQEAALAQRPTAELVVTTAADDGFGSAETVVDEPGQHEIVLRGERGSRLRFSTLTNATVAMETGCHLPAAIAAGGRAD